MTQAMLKMQKLDVVDTREGRGGLTLTHLGGAARYVAPSPVVMIGDCTMSQTTVDDILPRNALRSTFAVIAGFVAIFVLSLATDQVLHSLGVYPPWGEPMRATSLNLLALSYRLVYDTFGCYLTARLAPRHPMRHALILGASVSC